MVVPHLQISTLRTVGVEAILAAAYGTLQFCIQCGSRNRLEIGQIESPYPE